MLLRLPHPHFPPRRRDCERRRVCVDALPPGLQVSFFLFIVFVVYTMLPFSMRGAIFASAITCLSHTATLSICLASRVTELEPLVWQVRPRALEVN